MTETNTTAILRPTIARIELTMPEWVLNAVRQLPTTLPSLEERMSTVIEFAQLNVMHQTGGPFAAGVFERDSGMLLAMGVNRVMATICSSAHAEIMALSLAQAQLGTFDLGGTGLPAYQLVVNWRPCAMCYGATLWSGVRSLVVAGDGPELEEITGFDEGPVHPDWRYEAEQRGIEVVEDVCRDEAIAAFKAFASSRQPVYNARGGSG